MNKYGQQDEDAYRLPEGVKRVGYDTDTSRYTFRDRQGTIYQSEPGSEFGRLRPVLDPIKKVERERPEAFNDNEGSERFIPHSPRAPDEAAPRSFHDMLPSELITSPTTKPDMAPPSATFGGFAALVSPTRTDFGGLTSPTFKAAIPKVQGVMQSLKRSVTSATKKGGRSGRDRAMSTSTTDSKGSFDRSSIPGSSFYPDEKNLPGLSKKPSQESFNSLEKK